MQETLAPVSIKHFVFTSPIEMLIMFESIEVEKLTEDTLGSNAVFLSFASLSKGVPFPLAGGIYYCEFLFFSHAKSICPL